MIMSFIIHETETTPRRAHESDDPSKVGKIAAHPGKECTYLPSGSYYTNEIKIGKLSTYSLCVAKRLAENKSSLDH